LRGKIGVIIVYKQGAGYQCEFVSRIKTIFIIRGTWKGLVSVVFVPDEEEDERYLKGFGECGNCAS